MMKYLRFGLLFILFISIQIEDVCANDKVSKAAENLDQLIEYNSINNSKGLSENNVYLYSGDYFDEKYFKVFGEEELVNLGGELIQLKELNDALVEFNTQASKVEFYIYIDAIRLNNSVESIQSLAQVRNSTELSNQEVALQASDFYNFPDQGAFCEELYKASKLDENKSALLVVGKFLNYYRPSPDDETAWVTFTRHLVLGKNFSGKVNEINFELEQKTRDFPFSKEQNIALQKNVEVGISIFKEFDTGGDLLYLTDDLVAETQDTKEKEYWDDVEKMAGWLKTANDQHILYDESELELQGDNIFQAKAMDYKLKMLYDHAATKPKYYLIFKKVNYAFSQEEFNKFAKDVYEKSGLSYENAIIFTIPVYYGKAVQKGPLKLVDYDLAMYGLYSPNPDFNKLTDKLNVYNSIYTNFLDVYTEIPKPHKKIIHFLRCDGTSGSFLTEQEKGVKGHQNIIDLIFYYDKKNIKEVSRLNSAIDNIRRTQESEGTKDDLIAPLEKQKSDILAYGLENPEWEIVKLDLRLIENFIETPGTGKAPNHILYSKALFDKLYSDVEWNTVKLFSPEGIAEQHLTEVDISEYIYGAIDYVGIALAPTGFDVIADVAGFTYACCRGDAVDAAMYGGSIFLVAGSDIPIKAIRGGSRFLVSGGKIILKNSDEFAVALKGILKYQDDLVGEELKQSKYLFNLLENKSLSKRLETFKARDDLLLDFARSDELAEGLLNNPGLVEGWSSFKKAGLDDLARNTDNLDALNKALKQDGYDADYFENLLKTKSDPQKFIDDYVSKIGDNGKFVDDALENDYASYLTRKSKEGKIARDRADWNHARDYWLNDSPMARGNAFNETARIEGWYPFDEVTLANGKRVDSYRLPEGGNPGEIVSRKATDLGDIQLSTFESYLSEMKVKYAPGTPINAPKYGNQLKDKVLEGDLILELPDSNLNLSNIQDYIGLANQKGIKLRFKAE